MIAPTVADERAAALHTLGFPIETPWRGQRLLVRIVFFVLTGAAALLLNDSLRRLDLPANVLTGIVCLAAAEFLIQRKHFFWTGVELALWIAAMLCFVFALPSSGKPEAVLVVGAAIGVAGARMRNPLLAAAAACCIVVYADNKWASSNATIAVGSVITIAAAVALLREWKRRSTEQLFQAVVLIVPLSAYVLHVHDAHGLSAVVLAPLALWKRDRILLIAAAIAITITAIELSRQFLDIALEYNLIAGGLLALAVALILARVLRTRKTGFIATPEAAKSYDEAIQLIGAMHAGQPGSRDESADGFEGGGGGFGGAGASGNY